jgi:hypothetical protein
MRTDVKDVLTRAARLGRGLRHEASEVLAFQSFESAL